MGETEKQVKKYFSRKVKRGIYSATVAFLKKNYAPGKKLLDLGSGIGIFSDYAKKLGYAVRTCDYDPNYCVFPDVKIDICDGDWNPLPYKNQSFDVVLYTEVIEHVGNPLHWLREINRVLKPGGVVIVSTPNLLNWKQKLWFVFTSFFVTHAIAKKPGDHITHITPQFLNYFMNIEGFETHTFYANSYVPFTSIKTPNSALLSDTVFVVGKKK